jgi:hypothetical protein
MILCGVNSLRGGSTDVAISAADGRALWRRRRRRLITAIALWPWLQIGIRSRNSRCARAFRDNPDVVRPAALGQLIMTDDLPRTYVPVSYWRLPDAFLVLLAVAFAYGIAAAAFSARDRGPMGRQRAMACRCADADAGARARILVVCAAVVLPLAFLVIAHATIYDGIRHVLFVVRCLPCWPAPA